MTIKCKNLNLLHSYLLTRSPQLEHKPNGQDCYKFQGDELVISVYKTTTVQFQGNGANGEFAKKVKEFIEDINKK